jgi:hypothetical protein
LSSKEVTDDSGGTPVTTLHKRGRWRILQGPPVLGKEPVLYHQCIKSSVGGADQTLNPACFTASVNIGSGMYAVYKRAKPRWRCRICEKTPPDSIITTFTLLTYEETNQVVAKVTKAYYDQEDPNNYI